MSYETLIVETADGVTLIRLNRPEALNALCDQLMDELRRDSPQMFDVVLTRRNANWLKVLSARLGAPPTGGLPARIVVVVGMAHLIGPDGVPARLRALGYQVEGP